MEAEGRGLHGNASGPFDAPNQSGVLRSINLTPAAAAATITVTDASGNINITLNAPASGASVQRLLIGGGLSYVGPLTVVLTGAGAVFDMEID